MEQHIKAMADEGAKALHELVQAIKGHVTSVRAPHVAEADGQMKTAQAAYEECRKARVELEQFEQQATKTKKELNDQITEARTTLEHLHTQVRRAEIDKSTHEGPSRMLIGGSPHDTSDHDAESKRGSTRKGETR